MALPENPFEPFDIVLCGGPVVGGSIVGRDPAVYDDDDAGKAAVKAYLKSRDLKDLQLRAGVKPALVKIRRLPASWVRRLGSYTDAEGDLRAVRAGCVSIVDASGEKHKPAQTTQEQGVAMAGDDWADTIGNLFGVMALTEIAVAIVNQSSLPPRARSPFVLRPGPATESSPST